MQKAMSMPGGVCTAFESMAGRLEYGIGRSRLCKGTMPPEYETRRQRYDTITYDEISEQQAIYGTPQEVIVTIRRLQAETGCTTLLCWMNAGSRLTQEQVWRSMHRFAAEVMPACLYN